MTLPGQVVRRAWFSLSSLGANISWCRAESAGCSVKRRSDEVFSSAQVVHAVSNLIPGRQHTHTLYSRNINFVSDYVINSRLKSSGFTLSEISLVLLFFVPARKSRRQADV